MGSYRLFLPLLVILAMSALPARAGAAVTYEVRESIDASTSFAEACGMPYATTERVPRTAIRLRWTGPRAGDRLFDPDGVAIATLVSVTDGRDSKGRQTRTWLAEPSMCPPAGYWQTRIYDIAGRYSIPHPFRLTRSRAASFADEAVQSWLRSDGDEDVKVRCRPSKRNRAPCRTRFYREVDEFVGNVVVKVGLDRKRRLTWSWSLNARVVGCSRRTCSRARANRGPRLVPSYLL